MNLKKNIVGFAESDYRELVVKTAKEYMCVGFDILGGRELPERFAILRHDIDFSPQRALALARVEAEEGVKASYTVLMTGEYYNPFEKEVQRSLIEIERLGHSVGLHFDAAWHSISHEKDLEDALAFEAVTLTRLLEKKEDINFFSFHNTTPFSMGCKARSYAGLWNSYAGILQEKVQYTSDSNGYWIHRSWSELLAQAHNRIQVLTHPEWWCEHDAEPGEKIAKSIFDRGMQGWADYDQLLRRIHRLNVTGLDDLRLVGCGKDVEYLRYIWLAGMKELACLSALTIAFQKTECREFISGSNFENLISGGLSGETLKEIFENTLIILAGFK